ncbi:bacteriohemerythrin [Tissierella sp. MSJ-40]|uniref:Bacteriohemerythrin n=1 Tax=Tissierella simiarum TaxID=2841534 RepID=A0ABS6EA15_9FIRM|nr:bacteriohemerythrin [Tissierella simiarum]MBU5439691.1 bacteriohemerythrin [Tissierella simiarum]
MFKWRDDFSVNVEKIDEQHQELFNLGTSLYNIVSLKDGIDRYDEIIAILDKMKDYTVYHFKYEESLMKEHGYEDYEAHKMQHDSFIEKIQSIKDEDVDIKQKKIGMDLILFIANWIEKHILVTDMKYKEFLNDKGVL